MRQKRRKKRTPHQTPNTKHQQEDFVALYKGTAEWDAAPSFIERRIDPADGLAYTKQDFVSQYAGTKEWDAAGVKTMEKLKEKRIDPADGMAYTKVCGLLPRRTRTRTQTHTG